MCEVKMVTDAELRDKIHEEELAIKYAEIKRIQKGIKKRKIPRVSNEYIDYLREHKLPITQADITKSIHPPHLKFSRDADFAMQMLEAQYNGIMDGFKIQIGFILLCIFLYWVPLEWL